MSDLDKIREVFLSEVDDETREDNEAKIREWESALIHNQAFADWQSHDITRLIVQQVREAYRDIAVTLATNRSLTPEARASLWARQDAMVWILSVTEKDARGTLEQVEKEIRVALNAT